MAEEERARGISMGKNEKRLAAKQDKKTIEGAVKLLETVDRENIKADPPPTTPVFTTADSGRRKEFPSGALADGAGGRGRFDLLSPIAIKRLAEVFERGAKKYDDRNWEKGTPIHRFIDSGLRHVFQFMEGWRDEDHLAQAAWQLLGAAHTLEMINRGLLPEELDDMPTYLREEGGKG